jgi:hypothetical protein
MRNSPYGITVPFQTGATINKFRVLSESVAPISTAEPLDHRRLLRVEGAARPTFILNPLQAIIAFQIRTMCELLRGRRQNLVSGNALNDPPLTMGDGLVSQASRR